MTIRGFILRVLGGMLCGVAVYAFAQQTYRYEDYFGDPLRGLTAEEVAASHGEGPEPPYWNLRPGQYAVEDRGGNVTIYNDDGRKVNTRHGPPKTPTFASGPQPPGPEAHETKWSAWLAQELDGTAEYTLYTRRRVDVLTSRYAIEVERCERSKINEAIEQARYYATATGRLPVILLLAGRDGDDRDVADSFIRVAAENAIWAVAVVDVHNSDMDQIRAVLQLPKVAQQPEPNPGRHQSLDPYFPGDQRGSDRSWDRSGYDDDYYDAGNIIPAGD